MVPVIDPVSTLNAETPKNEGTLLLTINLSTHNQIDINTSKPKIEYPNIDNIFLFY